MTSASDLVSVSDLVSHFVLNYVLNAVWQIAVIALVAAVGSLLLRNAAARYRHMLWLAALGLCVIVPLLPATQTTPANRSLPPAPASAPQIPLGRVAPEPDLPVSHLTKKRTQVVSTTSQTALWLTLAYALFVAWRGIRFVRFWQRKERLRRSTSFAELTPVAKQAARRCRAIFGIENVDVVQANSARMPYTIGVRRPLIVLPEAFCTADEERLLSVVGHEMAHVARRDYLTNLICELALVPISFHPFAFLIKRQIDRARELACDELVTNRLLPRKLYARSLVWAADVSNQPRTQALLLSMFDVRSLEERVMRLTREQHMLGRSTAKAMTSITLLALCAAAVTLSLFSFELKTEAQQPVMEPQRAETRLDAQNAQQRAEAACAAGRQGNTEQIPVLIAMLADDTKTNLLRCWSNGRWSPALESFKHPSPGEQAAIALASMGRVALPPLTNQLDSESPTVRRNAAWAIGELTNMRPGERDGAEPRLITLLSDADPWARIAASRALGELRSRTAVPALFVTLGDVDARVRELAVWALSEIKDRREVAPLCNVLLSDLSADVRRGAAEALGEIRSAEALPFLKQALNDPAVSARARWAINEIEGN